ncbi:MAG: sulfur transferase domain-containing protein [Pseudomonadales bacterium]|nr:sulfur transferase domain-containing protein [Pseudomonadales bacterium]
MPKNFLSRISIPLLSLLALLTTQPAWSRDYSPNPSAQITTSAPAVAIKNAKQPFPGILTGGQPSKQQLLEAKQKGYKTIISLRTRKETGLWDEEKTVQDLGMKYVSIPVSGGSDVNKQNSQALIQALSDAKDYPVMVHCASGNRVGALFAIDAKFNRGMTSEQALQIGRDAGLTKLEETVKQILD